MNDKLEALRKAHRKHADATRAYRRATLAARTHAGKEACALREQSSKRIHNCVFEQEQYANDEQLALLDKQHDCEHAMRLARGELACAQFAVQLATQSGDE